MKILVVIGCAPCLQDDLKGLQISFPFDIMAVGVDSLGLCNLPISYVATYHKKDIPLIRRKAPGAKVICHEKIKRFENPNRAPDIIVSTLFGRGHLEARGSSALLGVSWALQEGYEKIVLVGCPLEGTNKTGHFYSRFHKGWEVHKDKVVGKVKSMSGWTKEFLGFPTGEWLNG
jgi:hypothetical protein